MDGAKVLMGVLLFLGLTGKVEAATSENSVAMKTQKKKQVTGDKLSLLIPSFVYHGIKPMNGSADDMPRKMDAEGRSVMTPGIGLEYKSEGGWLFVGALLKDCYDNLAGTFQVGHQWDFSDRSSFGLTMGVYSRQTPYTCDTEGYGPFATTSCRELDRYDWKFKTMVNGYNVDIIPMPFAHVTVALLKTRGLQIDLKVMTNVLLNEVGIGVPF